MSEALETILSQVRELSPDERSKGRIFEHLIARFLQSDPLYHSRYEAVYLWEDWPYRWGMDRGIDLVALDRHTGEYCAIQCKFYDAGAYLQKHDIDSFLGESGKEFETSDGKKRFASRMIVSTTDHWGRNAEQAIENQSIATFRLGLKDLYASSVDWSDFQLFKPHNLSLKPKKELREHQLEAIADVLRGFTEHDRGKLIMACGTGKTLTALRLYEQMALNGNNLCMRILFLAPSISLVSQSLREWSNEAHDRFHGLVVCSDTKVGRDSEDLRLHDLAYPATTDARKIFEAAQNIGSDSMVIFSTYQSIQVVADAQGMGLGKFDLVICDEAHRTTGVTLSSEKTSHFNKVHDNAVIVADKRLYMTATPRIYAEKSKKKANEREAILYSMDDENIFGPEFYRLSFGEAVKKDLLSDYKVLIITVQQQMISALVNAYNRAFQFDKDEKSKAIDIEFATKIIGSWKGLSKQDWVWIDDDGEQQELPEGEEPMRRAVAFSNSIAASKQLTEVFDELTNLYRQQAEDDDVDLVTCAFEHVDGTMNALMRAQSLDWLHEGDQDGCRVLSNARCLSEGIDVPALDGVIFFDTRESMVDIVQSVGRVMRKAPGKEHGHIILPVCIPSEHIADYDRYLQGDSAFQGIWKVIKALRAHDEALVDEAEFRKKIRIITGKPKKPKRDKTDDGQDELDFPPLPIDKISEAVYAATPKKLGDLEYWSSWAEDVANIAERMIERTSEALKHDDVAQEFARFMINIRDGIHPQITEGEAVEMLVQHNITRPIFAALFDNYSFVDENPVSQSMQRMMDILNTRGITSETDKMERFYDQAKERVSNAKSDKSKQEVIRNLYDTFFNTAFPRMATRLGIVYTPIPVVDFILHSVQHALLKHFASELNDRQVHVLDPFTGTGTFLVRLLQSGLISPQHLGRKYRHELHANEIVLLAYYIAAINIESAFHALSHEYQPFGGIVLTDSFQMHEKHDWADTSEQAFLYENNSRVEWQKNLPIRVILGNPPYSTGQHSANDDNQKQSYPSLDQSIRDTYAKHSTAKNKSSLYDSYIRALRLASNRIEDKGIVAFVTNGSFIDGNAADGLRHQLMQEFSHLYILNLRGNQRTSGEESRREGGKIFGSGSRTQVAISILVKDPSHQGDAELYYHDIGDYLSREQKLEKLEQYAGIAGISWQRLIPNAEHDWINPRDPAFDTFIPLGDKDTKSPRTIFATYSSGVKTNRDAWVYNFSRPALEGNMQGMIAHYNQQVASLATVDKPDKKHLQRDSKKISWAENLEKDALKQKNHHYSPQAVVPSTYRPYTKQWLYGDPSFIERIYQNHVLFPTPQHDNMIISLTGIGANKPFSALVMDTISDLEAISKGQCFPLYWYEKVDQHQANQASMFDQGDHAPDHAGYIRREAITDWALQQFQQHYADNAITKPAIFAYIYGIMHSPEYRQRFASNLKRMLPRLPFAGDFWAFSNTGQALIDCHLNYETAELYPLTEHNKHLIPDPEHYIVHQMRFAKQGKQEDKSTIVYNAHVSLHDIPLEAYDYQVNGKSAIEWIIERYAFTTNKDSGIINDANLWSDDPRYIINHLKRIVTISLNTIELAKSLPPLNEG